MLTNKEESEYKTDDEQQSQPDEKPETKPTMSALFADEFLTEDDLNNYRKVTLANVVVKQQLQLKSTCTNSGPSSRKSRIS